MKQVVGLAWWPGYLPFSFDGGINVNPYRFQQTPQAWSTSKWLTYTYDFSVNLKATGKTWVGHLVLTFDGYYGDLASASWDYSDGQVVQALTWTRSQGRYRDSQVFSASNLEPDTVPWPQQGHTLPLPIAPFSVPVTSLTATQVIGALDDASYLISASAGLSVERTLTDAQVDASAYCTGQSLASGEETVQAVRLAEYAEHWEDLLPYVRAIWFGFEPQALARLAASQEATNQVCVLPLRSVGGLVRTATFIPYTVPNQPYYVAPSTQIVAANGVLNENAQWVVSNTGDWWDAPHAGWAILSVRSLFGFSSGLNCANAWDYYLDPVTGYLYIYDYAVVRPWASSTGSFGAMVIGHKNLPAGLHTFAQDAAVPYLPGGYVFGEVRVGGWESNRPNGCP